MQLVRAVRISCFLKYFCITFTKKITLPKKKPHYIVNVKLQNEYKKISSFPAICNPPCMNGGTCLSYNMCRCRTNFVGSQCQYSVDRCAPERIGFNGGIRCVRTSTTMSCTLSCPQGVNFDSPPAPTYTCTFATGVFTPTRVPQCVFGKQKFSLICNSS